MDADPLSLLVILRQELKDIANTLQPPPDITEDIMTDNGLRMLNNQENENPNLSAPLSEHEQDEDEKAPELLQVNSKPNDTIACKIDKLIENYLTPTIKQLNKKKRKRNKKRSNLSNYYASTETHPSPSQVQSPSSLYPTPSPQHHSYPPSTNSEPGQMIDDVSHYSEKLGSCCRKFVTSLFCGCGMFQTIGIFVVLLTFGMVFVFYRASELTLILKEINHWKELSVKRIEYELTSQQKMAQINFDMDVDIDKLKQEHQHRVTMEIIEAKKSLTKEFIDKNTRTVTTTYWNLLTTETETVSQTIFSEDDIAFFQNNILYYGFSNNGEKAIESPPQRSKEDDKQTAASASDDNGTSNQNECDNMDDHTASCHDSFDSI